MSGTMSLARRRQLLRVASWLDRRAADIRKFVKAKTPKRQLADRKEHDP